MKYMAMRELWPRHGSMDQETLYEISDEHQ